MNQRIYRSIEEKIREGLSWEERWRGDDNGFILCWEIGRELRTKDSELSQRAVNNELPVLGWKGGVDRKILKGEKYGTFNYLAQWQGLRGEDLNIDLTQEIVLICSRTGMRVTYTADAQKYESV